jgi:hypothetical protein
MANLEVENGVASIARGLKRRVNRRVLRASCLLALPRPGLHRRIGVVARCELPSISQQNILRRLYSPLIFGFRDSCRNGPVSHSVWSIGYVDCKHMGIAMADVLAKAFSEQLQTIARTVMIRGHDTIIGHESTHWPFQNIPGKESLQDKKCEA